MRSILLLSVLLSGCSLVGSDDVPFRSLASSSVSTQIDFAALVESTSDEAMAREALGLTAPFSVDYATETVLIVSTFDGCPSSQYRIAVVGIEGDGDDVIVDAEVTVAGDAGADVVTYPYDVVAFDKLVGGVTVRVVGERSQDCIIRT